MSAIDDTVDAGASGAPRSAIERAIAANLFDVLWMDRCPVLASVRTHPRWAALHAEVAERASKVAALIGHSNPQGIAV